MIPPKYKMLPDKMLFALSLTFLPIVTAVMRNYNVAVTLQSRLAITTISVEVVNDRSCVLVSDYVVQHPASAYLIGVKITDSDTGCFSEGRFEAAEQARSEFAKSVSQGKTAALISSYKVGAQRLKLSVAPRSTSRLVVTYSEVLEMRQGQLKILVPISTLGPASLVQGNLAIHVNANDDGNIFHQGGKLSCGLRLSSDQARGSERKICSYHYIWY